MTRSLVLMRHAEAVAEAAQLADFQRPLTTAGGDSALLAARRMAHEGLLPQRVLCSPAVRTMQTAQIVQLTLELPAGALQADMALYQAAPATLRQLIAQCDAAVTCLLVIGHNPGISRLLGESSALHARTALGTAEFRSFPVGEWSDLTP